MGALAPGYVLQWVCDQPTDPVHNRGICVCGRNGGGARQGQGVAIVVVTLQCNTCLGKNWTLRPTCRDLSNPAKSRPKWHPTGYASKY